MTARSTATPTDPTTADALRDDPRVAQARELLHQALAEHAGSLDSVRPPDPDRATAYQQLLDRFGQVRGGTLWYPYLGSGIGHGPLVELDDGSVKYDMICGIGVHFFGHSHPGLLDASIDAALADTVMQGNLQQNTDSLRLSETLLEMATASDAPLAHVFLTTSGAMAKENALKIVFQRHAPADRILAFENCFCGRTMVLSHITDKAAYRVGIPQTVNVDYVPFYDESDPEASTRRSLETLEAHLKRYPGRHAAMIFELIQGEGGYYAGTREYFTKLMTRLKEAGVAVIADEIQTFGRTTRPFAFQHFGLDPLIDVVTVGKLTQVCATLFRDEYNPKPGLISQTFTGSTSSIHAAQRILDRMNEGDLYGEDGLVAQRAAQFRRRFQKIAAAHPDRVRGPYGEGAMLAFTPLDGSPATVKKLLTALFDAGVVAFGCGADPMRLRFLPPMPVLSERQVDEVCDIVERALAEVAGD